MELFFGGAGIIVTKKIDNELCVLIGKRSDGQGWAIPAGKRKVSDGILKFTAIRELNEEFGFKIPQTPDFLMRVRFVFRNFAPYVSHGKELMAVSEVFRFDLEEFEPISKISTVEYGVRNVMYTTLYLLKNATTIHELSINNRKEIEVYKILKKISNDKNLPLEKREDGYKLQEYYIKVYNNDIRVNHELVNINDLEALLLDTSSN